MMFERNIRSCPYGNAQRQPEPRLPDAVRQSDAQKLPEVDAVTGAAEKAQHLWWADRGRIVSAKQTANREEANAARQGHREAAGRPIDYADDCERGEGSAVRGDHRPQQVSLHLHGDRPEVPDMAVVRRLTARNDLVGQEGVVLPIAAHIAALPQADRQVEAQVGEEQRGDPARTPTPEIERTNSAFKLARNQVAGQSKEHGYAKPALSKPAEMKSEDGQHGDPANAVKRWKSIPLSHFGNLNLRGLAVQRKAA